MKTPAIGKLHEVIGGRWLSAPGAARQSLSGGVHRIVTDSRHVEPKDVFWALSGPHFDGNDFVREALDRGATGAVVSRPIEAPADRWVLRVDDTLDALWKLAAWKRRQFHGELVAVTGSVGKTTTRQMIDTVLRAGLTGTCSPRNYNNRFGVPLSLLQIEPEHDYAVIELGASGRGEIAELARLCKPTIGVITQIGEAHLGGFGSRQVIAETKAELLDALPPEGKAVLGDDPWLRRLGQNTPAGVIRVGRGSDCHLTATDVQFHDGELSFSVDGHTFRVPVWGRHNLTAALAAVAVGQLLEFEPEVTARALGRFESVPLRCQVEGIRGATIINDTYNSSPTAMRAALELLREFDSEGRRIIVSGDMGELGEEAVRLHYRLGGEIVTVSGADLLIACGKYARHVVAGARAAGMPKNRAIPCDSPEETLPYLGQAILPGDLVLVKGTRTLAMERIVRAMADFPCRRGA